MFKFSQKKKKKDELQMNHIDNETLYLIILAFKLLSFPSGILKINSKIAGFILRI